MKVDFRGPAGRIEGLLEEPEGGSSERSGVAVVCHPHPLYAGSMRNAIVFRTARALRAAGLATLRFDFRGVGASEGEHDGKGAEEGDVAAALDFLGERYPGLPAWAAGYSFGALTVCGLAAGDPRIERLILVALPVAVYDCPCVEGLAQPALLVFGAEDELGTSSELARKHPDLAGLREGRLEVEDLPGADHFFRGRTPVLEARVRAYAQSALAETR